MDITEVKAERILTPQKFGSLAGSYDYSLNPYAGCAFSCTYCYVPKFPNARHDDFRQWGKWIEVKVNAPELIRKERTLVFGSSIFFSSATDPYQYLELKYRLSRQCLRELKRYQPKRLTLHTRSHLILQDIDLLSQFGSCLSVGISITTDDEDIQREFEPMAPSIKRRLELLKTLSENGINVYVSMSPLLPCNPQRFISLIKPFTTKVWVDAIRYPEINNRPHLLEKHKQFFQPENYSQVQEAIAAGITDLQKTVRGGSYKKGKVGRADSRILCENNSFGQLKLLLTNV
ncbi:MAG: radical SAM protein [Cyanobacteria bacterium]|nr:radical SAM protein [Cyanobacteriota bacterium]